MSPLILFRQSIGAGSRWLLRNSSRQKGLAGNSVPIVANVGLQVLILLIFGGISCTASADSAANQLPVVDVTISKGPDLQSNQFKIGDVVVNGTISNGIISGERWMAINNELWRFQEVCKTSELFPGDSYEHGLRLMYRLGKQSSMWYPKGRELHGLLYGNIYNMPTPDIAGTNFVDILASPDKVRIVLMVLTNGPIYSSTNSGMNWTVITAPGTYDFPLDAGPGGSEVFGIVTLHSSAENQTATNFPTLNWYAVGTAANGDTLVISQDAPILSISHAGNSVVLSWPSSFTGFVLQQTKDLATANWSDVTNVVNVVGDQNQVTLAC